MSGFAYKDKERKIRVMAEQASADAKKFGIPHLLISEAAAPLFDQCITEMATGALLSAM